MDDNEADNRDYKWNISPHPYDSEFDTMVTDDDKEALKAILDLAEKTWDGIEENETRIITIERKNINKEP